jgi:hypothetical protein
MKPIAKIVKVTLPNGDSATFITVVYEIGNGQFGIEFYRYVWTVNESGFRLPQGITPDFQTELRATGRASAQSDTFENVNSIIILKMKEAYGADSEIDIQELSRTSIS